MISVRNFSKTKTSWQKKDTYYCYLFYQTKNRDKFTKNNAKQNKKKAMINIDRMIGETSTTKTSAKLTLCFKLMNKINFDATNEIPGPIKGII